MNRTIPALAAFLLCLGGALLCAQAQTGSDNPDSLFNDGTSVAPPPGGQPAETPGTASVRPDDLLKDNKVHFFGSVDIYGLAGIGWSQFPQLAHLADSFGPEGGGSLTTNIGFEVRPVSELRVRGTLSYYFPTQGPLFSEMIVDYSILDSVFFRVGSFAYTWGNSQFFQYANLPSRSLPTFVSTTNLPLWEQNNLLITTVTQTVPVSLKINIPFGLNGLTLLARFDLANYFPNPSSPSPKDAGYGLQYDMVTGPIEWSVAGFWQYLLTPRTLLAMKTTVSGFDVSAEMTMAFPARFTLSGVSPITTTGGGIFVGGELQRIYPTAVIGVSREWT
ncbi:MAG TPA: hypothetical protein VFB30_14160, partial [Spirochaetia bacterium]|nr:hypothetical protein [Spirochaetia bacterium]